LKILEKDSDKGYQDVPGDETTCRRRIHALFEEDLDDDFAVPLLDLPEEEEVKSLDSGQHEPHNSSALMLLSELSLGFKPLGDKHVVSDPVHGLGCVKTE
jgi:hypothetical protein